SPSSTGSPTTPTSPRSKATATADARARPKPTPAARRARYETRSLRVPTSTARPLLRDASHRSPPSLPARPPARRAPLRPWHLPPHHRDALPARHRQTHAPTPASPSTHTHTLPCLLSPSHRRGPCPTARPGLRRLSPTQGRPKCPNSYGFT